MVPVLSQEARVGRDEQQEKITAEIFDHLVHLAEFDLTPDESEYLRRELNGQLKAVRELESIEVGPDVPITSHGVPYTRESTPALRMDESHPCPEADAILAQAPEVDGRYVVVPDIPHTELE